MLVEFAFVCGKSDKEGLESLDHRELSQEGIDPFERFVCQLYTKSERVSVILVPQPRS